MNTEWWIRAYGATQAVLMSAETLVRDIESRLSRFRADSSLTRLNQERAADDALLAAVVTAALQFREATGAVFDPGIGAALISAGYDRSFECLSVTPSREPRVPDGRRPSVTVEGSRVRLEGEGSLDLGGIGKGWAVDRVAEHLEAHGVDRYLVDGGGDLRAGRTPAAPWPVGVGDGLVAWLGPGAVATSSIERRRWTDGAGHPAHHVIDTSTNAPAFRGLRTAVVTHRLTTTADVLATTLLAGGPACISAVGALGGEALMKDMDGSWWMTPGMQRWLDGPTLG